MKYEAFAAIVIFILLLAVVAIDNPKDKFPELNEVNYADHR